MFGFLVLNIFFSLNNFARWLKRQGIPEETGFLNYVPMLRISILIFFIGSSFTNVLFHDIFWSVVAISMAMNNISKSSFKGYIPKTRIERWLCENF
jgi:hypothetical protein